MEIRTYLQPQGVIAGVVISKSAVTSSGTVSKARNQTFEVTNVPTVYSPIEIVLGCFFLALEECDVLITASRHIDRLSN